MTSENYPRLSDLDLHSARRVSFHRYVRHDDETPNGWTDDGPCPGHHSRWSRSVKQDTPPGIIDPMEAFAETPRMLPTFSTRNGLRMSYVDSSGKQRCLNLNTADLTRIINSAAMALEIVTREQTMADDIPAYKA